MRMCDVYLVSIKDLETLAAEVSIRAAQELMDRMWTRIEQIQESGDTADMVLYLEPGAVFPPWMSSNFEVVSTADELAEQCSYWNVGDRLGYNVTLLANTPHSMEDFDICETQPLNYLDSLTDYDECDSDYE